MAGIKPKRKNFVLIGLIAISSLSFVYYLLGYIPAKEKGLYGQGTRVLNRIGENLSDKFDHSKNILETNKTSYLLYSDLMIERQLEEAGCLDKEESTQKSNPYNFFDEQWLEELKTKEKRYSQVKKKVNFRNKIRQQAGEAERESEKEKRIRIREEKLKNISINKSFIHLNPQLDSLKKIHNELHKKLMYPHDFEKVKGKNFTLSIPSENYGERRYYISIKDFTRSCKRFDFFDDVILVDSNKNIVDESQLNLEKLVIKDSSYIDSLIVGVEIYEQSISRKDYLVFTKKIQLDHEEFKLIGLKSKDVFTKQSRSIDPWLIIVGLAIILFLILIMPIIKPFLLSQKERLSNLDIYAAGFSIIFSVSVLTLIIVGIYTFWGPDAKHIDNQLDHLSKKIKGAFLNEVKSAISDLRTVRESGGMGGYNEPFDSLESKRVNEIFFVQEDGTTDYFIDALGKRNKDKKIDVSKRDYYQRLKIGAQKRPWQIDSIPYYLQSIVSLSSGEHESAISTRLSEDDLISVITLELKSLSTPRLPKAYSFCVIDQLGTVNYHSDPTKIKNENYIEECGFDEMLQSYINNKTDGVFHLSYANNDYRVDISPIENTELFLVVMHSSNESRHLAATVFILTIITGSGIFLYILLLHSFMFFDERNNSFLKTKNFMYKWLNPLGINPRIFNLLIAFNSVLIVSEILIYLFEEDKLFFNINIVLAFLTLALLFHYNVLRHTHSKHKEYNLVWPKNKLSGFEICSLVLLFVWTGLALSESRSWIAISGLCVGMIILIGYKLNYFNNGFLNKMFRGIRGGRRAMLRKYLPITKDENNLENDQNSVFIRYKQTNYNSYYIFLLSWIVLVSILPTSIFFKNNFNYENHLRQIHELVDILQFEKDHQDNLRVKYCYTFSEQKFDAVSTPIDTCLTPSDKLYSLIRPYFDHEEKIYSGIVKQESVRKTLKVTKKDSLVKVEDHFYKEQMNNFLIAENRLYSPLFLADVWISKTLLLIGVFMLFTLIYFVVKKLIEQVFYLEIIRKMQPYFTSGYNERMSKVSDGLKNQRERVMIVGPPFSGRNRAALSILNIENNLTQKQLSQEEVEKAHIVNLDFIHDLDRIFEKVKNNESDYTAKNIIVNHMEYRISDFDYNHKKLEILEYILALNRFKIEETFSIILISSVDIYQIIDLYSEGIKELESDANENNERIEYLRNDMDRWESVLFVFTKEIIPLCENRELAIKNVIDKELRFGNLLNKLETIASTYWNRIKEDESEFLTSEEQEEKMVLKIQDLAENYYFSIWNTCSKQERYVLYDLAQDEIANPANKKTIFGLVNKGIISFTPHLRIFNRSFTNFILESVSKEEALKMEQEAKSEGTWSSYRLVFIFIIVILFGFMSFAEEQMISKITALISVGAVLLPGLLNIGTSMLNFKLPFGKKD